MKDAIDMEKMKDVRLRKYLTSHPETSFAKQFVPEELITKSWRKAIERDQLKFKKKLRRFAKIVALRNSGMTLEEVGKSIGRTRERTRQLLLLAEAQGFVVIRKGHIRKPRKEVSCPCGKTLEVVEDSKRKFCNRACFEKFHSKYATKEESSKAQSVRVKWRYHNEPGFKAKRIAMTMKWHDKIKHEPKFRAKWAVYQREYIRRKSLDPIWAAKQKLIQQKRYQKFRATLVVNPVKLREWSNRNNARNRARYARRKALSQ